MKFIVDAQLPFRLKRWLINQGMGMSSFLITQTQESKEFGLIVPSHPEFDIQWEPAYEIIGSSPLAGERMEAFKAGN